VKYDKEPAIGGLLLLGSGLGLIFGVKPVRRNQQEALR